MKNKSIIAVVMVALIAAAGFGGYVVGSQNDDNKTQIRPLLPNSSQRLQITIQCL